MTLKDSRLLTFSFALEITGAFHLTQISGNFGWYIKWNGLCENMDQLRRWSTLTGPVISVGQTEMPSSFDKIIVPSTALLYPAFKDNNQTHGGLGRIWETGMYRSIRHVEFPKFQTGIFVEWKAPCLFSCCSKRQKGEG